MLRWISRKRIIKWCLMQNFSVRWQLDSVGTSIQINILFQRINWVIVYRLIENSETCFQISRFYPMFWITICQNKLIMTIKYVRTHKFGVTYWCNLLYLTRAKCWGLYLMMRNMQSVITVLKPVRGTLVTKWGSQFINLHCHQILS